MSTVLYDEESQEDWKIIDKFNTFKDDYYKQVEKEFKDYINEPNNKELLKCLKRKYNYLYRCKLTKRTNINKCKAYIKEILDYDSEKESIFSEVEKHMIYSYCISKIRGLYKHAQALKTGFCNGQLITGFSEEKTLSICVTKNTLEANSQWLERLYKELDSRYPKVKLNDKIMIISSKKDNLNGNATHCKNIDVAWSYLKKTNHFKIIFICSNKVRIQDIYEIAISFSNLKLELNKNLRIFHDEAHNPKEGIPPFRDIIENILVLPNILSYQPITASLGKIVDNDNPLWINNNLEKYAINFTEFDNTKSDNPTYSSCSDYTKITFESLNRNCNWINYENYEITRENFMNVTDKYKYKTLDELTNDEIKDIDKRRTLEFCIFMKFNKEKEALSNGFNVLNLNTILETSYFIEDEFNLHIISTPNRKIISQEICIKAIEMDYNPIVLGIYGNQGNKFHLFINGMKEQCVDDKMGDGEFNTKLFNLITYLKDMRICTMRPFIIVGNYTPTGESLSYVNYKYGTVRSVIRLISTNAEEDYQSACRGNYMNTKFLENNADWKPSKKMLIGHQNFIDNALSYEAENDARIDWLNNIPIEDISTNIILPSFNSNSLTSNGITAIPIKIDLNTSEPKIQQLLEIASKTRRDTEDKANFMEILKECCENDEIECTLIDKSGKFNWDMTLKDFRCYKYKQNQPPKPGYWKFKNYQNNFKTGQPFINNNNNHNVSDCEILICKDKYIIKDTDSKILEQNFTSTWWMGYKYV